MSQSIKLKQTLDLLKSQGSNTPKTTGSNLKKDFTFYHLSMKDIRSIAKKLKVDHDLALELMQENIYEAMMLSGMILDPKKLDLNTVKAFSRNAKASNIIDQAISDSVLQMKEKEIVMHTLMESDEEFLRYAGFAFLSAYFRKEPLETVDVALGLKALSRIANTIGNESLDIQNAMNNAVVMAGLHVPALVTKAYEVAKSIGYIVPRERLNQCNIQSAHDYLIRYRDNVTYSRVAKFKQSSLRKE